MIKCLYYFFVLLLLSGCSKDDPDKGVEEPFYPIEKLVGGWAYDTVEFERITYAYPNREECNKDFIVFRNNEGQLHQFTETIFLDENCATESTIMDWRVEGKTLNLFFGE